MVTGSCCLVKPADDVEHLHSLTDDSWQLSEAFQSASLPPFCLYVSLPLHFGEVKVKELKSHHVHAKLSSSLQPPFSRPEGEIRQI